MSRVDTQVHHRSHVRTDVESPADIGEIAKVFADRKLGTGGKMPYHLFIGEGKVFQALPLSYLAPGAAGYNARGIQVAWLLDLRNREPSEAMAQAGRDCVTLLRFFTGAQIVGEHTKLKNATKNASKICPGKHWPDLTDARHNWAPLSSPFVV